MEMSKILQLIDAVNGSELTELSLEECGEKLTLKRAGASCETLCDGIYGSKYPAANWSSGPELLSPGEENRGKKKVYGSESEEKSEGEKSEREISEGELITSPMVGTFYSSPSEEEAPYVKVGDYIKKGQALGIIETMKLMNEITSDRDGVIAEVLVENEQVVEYGQGLFRIR